MSDDTDSDPVHHYEWLIFAAVVALLYCLLLLALALGLVLSSRRTTTSVTDHLLHIDEVQLSAALTTPCPPDSMAKARP